MPRRLVEYANLVVTGADDAQLFDLFDDYVWPAISNPEEERKHGDTTFLFPEAGGYVIDGNAVVLGRFAKVMKLAREQYFDEGKIIHSTKTLDTAPSAVFMIHLNTHKMVYFHETAYAPTLGQFRHTLHVFASRLHDQRLHQKAIAEGRALYLVRSENSMPEISVIPLSNPNSIGDFMGSFKTVSRVDIQLVRPNSEIDLDPFFDKVRQSQVELKADNSTLTYTSKEGLDRDETTTYLEHATASGNSYAKVRGKDEAGQTIVGDNNKFNIKTAVTWTAKALPELAVKMLRLLLKQFESGNVLMPPMIEDTSARAVDIAEQHGYPTLQASAGDDDDEEGGDDE